MSCKCCGKEECSCAKEKDCATNSGCGTKCGACFGKMLIAALLGVALTFAAISYKHCCCSSQCHVKVDDVKKSK